MSGTKIFYKTIYIPIYSGYFQVIIHEDFKEVDKLFKLDLSQNSINNSKGVVGDLYNKEDKLCGYFLLIKPKSTLNIIAHEAYHIVTKLFEDRGIIPDYKNDEPVSYFLGWVVEQIELALNKYKKNAERAS